MDKIRVLIADDEEIERAALKKTLLKNLGERCEIFEAENGRQALEAQEKQNIKIAVLDIEMPGVSGIQAAERIREKDRECCIIFLTAFDEFSYARKAITVRAMDYLLKPFNEEELLLVMEEAIRTAEGLKKDFEAGKEEAGQEEKLPAEPKEGQEEDGEELGFGRQQKVMQILEEYIQSHYMYDISMQDVAQTMNYSEAYFSKLFKQCFQKNFTAYLTEFRVNEAKRQLRQPTINVKDVGKAVGYADSNYFTKVFRRITGMSPTEYRLSVFQDDI